VIEEIRRICELQPEYSSENTPAMEERGRLIRRLLPERIRELEPNLRTALGHFGGDFDVEASDGIGRKTEAPWVRIFAKGMSPNPRDGFYVVFHFAADGSSVFVTVGCGSTVWANGELRPVSDDELLRRVEWARLVIREKFGTIDPFGDDIALGARAPLTKTFEKATAVAKRIPVAALEERELHVLLVQATDRLRAIYDAQRTGSHLGPTDTEEREIESTARPLRGGRVGQGFRISPHERRAVELRAMEVARDWLVAQGFSIRDVSLSSSFDYEATKGGETLKIEVKGTTGDGADEVLMTKNEVDLHTAEQGKTGLIVVSGIRLNGVGETATASGGHLSAELCWDIREWVLVPLAYRVVRNRAS